MVGSSSLPLQSAGATHLQVRSRSCLFRVFTRVSTIPNRLAAVKAVVCIVGIIAGGRLLVRPLYRRISALKNSDVFAATTLLVVLGTSVLTQAAGLSLALGAFLVRHEPS